MINLDEFPSFFVANWKLNSNISFIDDYINNLQTNTENCLVICPPSIYLNLVKTNSKNLFLGSQDVSMYDEGAYTGEVSVNMLVDNKVNFSIVGHSERRSYFNETNEKVLLKTNKLIEKSIIPIVCIGETLEQKEKKITKEVLRKQIQECIPKNSNFKNTLIAYEPIWAIGTGLTPSVEQIDEVHAFIKNHDNKFNNFKILYGGSVKSSNSEEINKSKNVNGCLVGGASLNVNEFNKILV